MRIEQGLKYSMARVYLSDQDTNVQRKTTERQGRPSSTSWRVLQKEIILSASWMCNSSFQKCLRNISAVEAALSVVNSPSKLVQQEVSHHYFLMNFPGGSKARLNGILLNMAAQPGILTIWKLKACLGYTASSRSTWATQTQTHNGK